MEGNFSRGAALFNMQRGKYKRNIASMAAFQLKNIIGRYVFKICLNGTFRSSVVQNTNLNIIGKAIIVYITLQSFWPDLSLPNMIELMKLSVDTYLCLRFLWHA